MSVVFVVAPAVIAGWPVLCGAVAATAAVLGYKARRQESGVTETAEEQWVEVTLEGSEVIAEGMARESEFAIEKDGVTAAFRRAPDGRCTVHVSGKDKSEQELSAVGQELLGRVTQHYTYNRVLTELKKQGFTVSNEEVTADQSIRINVAKYV